MRRAAFAAAVALAAATAVAAPDGWLRSLEDGLEAARASRRPVLVVTAWTDQQ